RQELAAARRAGKGLAVPDDLPAQERQAGPGAQAPARIRGVVDSVMQVRVVEHEVTLVPNNHVGVGADGQRSLARIQPVRARKAGACQLDGSVQADATAQHPFGIQQRHPRFDAGDAVGNMAEGDFFARRRLAVFAVKIEWRVVGREHLEQAVGQPLPYLLLRSGVAGRRAAYATRAVITVVDAQVFGCQEQVLRAGFGIDVQARGAGVADLVYRL